MASSTLLHIYIITYNRAAHLQRTVEALVQSAFSRFPIYIFDNCSTDNTQQVAAAAEAAHPNVQVVTHPKNIGACANYLRAIEHSNAEYTWVLCDDDDYHFSEVGDLLNMLEAGKHDLIHVGAHPYNKWEHFSGKTHNLKDLVAAGYPYFSFASFLPCSIFKTERFNNKFLIQGYENIANQYPHMPFFIQLYNSNEPLYITRHQLVKALLGNQFYTSEAWFGWWMKTCQLLATPEEVRTAFWDQWQPAQYKSVITHLAGLALNNKTLHNVIGPFVNNYFTTAEKVRFFLYREMFRLNKGRKRLLLNEASA